MPALLKRYQFALLLLVAFLFRLGFGLCAAFQDADATQIYLLGLKFYTTHAWPDFGPDELRTAIEEYARRRRRFGGR